MEQIVSAAYGGPGWSPWDHGCRVLFAPDDAETLRGMALNFVTLGPRRVLMPAGNPVTQAFLEAHGVTCVPVEVDELLKAAGGVGCLTGVLERANVRRAAQGE